ncbi:MAG: FkbM family methyltransferase [Calothrix sp. FI2-JRJ7]|jgi:FkbM family methyltransferase|nr:FkbM family methyltransferase [Calothrix sp. FI2-JRJ7]
MLGFIPEITLPNGVKIFYKNREEVEFLYEEMPLYLQNGIELHEGATVFDVGANIGLFTLYVSKLCNKNVNIYAFEPVPAIFGILQCNVQRLNSEKIQIFPYGVSHSSGTVNFAYYPNCTGWSTLYPDDSQYQRDLIKNVTLNNLNEAPAFIRWLRWIPSFVRAFILDQKINKAFQAEQITCHLKKLSEIIREQNIEKIDLLKVDVERSELDVLLGIEVQDWYKIKQVVLEVHDLDGRVQKVKDLLMQHGFSKITIEQQNFLKGHEYFNVYALR